MRTRLAALGLILGGLAACSSDPINTAGRPDNTPGNPPGTAFSRTNTSVGDPLNLDNTRDCTPNNPPGTVVSRTIGTADNRNCNPVSRSAPTRGR